MLKTEALRLQSKVYYPAIYLEAKLINHLLLPKVGIIIFYSKTYWLVNVYKTKQNKALMKVDIKYIDSNDSSLVLLKCLDEC